MSNTIRLLRLPAEVNIGEMTMGDFLKTFTERDLRRIPNLGMDSLKIFRHLLEDAQYPPLKET